MRGAPAGSNRRIARYGSVAHWFVTPGDPSLDRREFLGSIAGVSALVPALAFLPALEQQAFAEGVHARAQGLAALRSLSPEADATLSGIADILLPQTDTVGALQIGANRFIDLLLTESMLESDRNRFLEGLKAIDAQCVESHGAHFAAAARAQQEALIHALDARLTGRAPTRPESLALEKAPVTAQHGYALVKQLVGCADFTSEPVAKGLINAPIIPGRYDGCVGT